MLPPARIAACIELLGDILASLAQERGQPMDNCIDRYFKQRRFIGSKDRAFIGEFVYWCVRHKASLEWHAKTPSARAIALTALTLRGENAESFFTGGQYAPTPLSAEEKRYLHSLRGTPFLHPDMPLWVKHNYPQWLHTELQAQFGNHLEVEMEALNRQAPVDIRANTLKTTREALQKALAHEGIESTPAPLAPHALRLEKRGALFASPLFKAGHFEMQDAGSQCLAHLAGAKAGMKVIDFCAGAGGKTLAMAADMRNKGRILAWDVSEPRLMQIKPRLKRTGVDNVQLHVLASEHDPFIKRHKESADIVLVDAPCSGSGTWRRNPDLKWRLTHKGLQELILLQERILESAARLVKPGGRLIYSTCSLLQGENERQSELILSKFSHFRVVSPAEIWDKTALSGQGVPPCLRLTPHQDGVDGFFAAVFTRLA